MSKESPDLTIVVDGGGTGGYKEGLQRGTLPPLSYVAGRQSGVSVRLVEE